MFSPRTLKAYVFWSLTKYGASVASEIIRIDIVCPLHGVNPRDSPLSLVTREVRFHEQMHEESGA